MSSGNGEPKERAKVLGREARALPKRFYKDVGLGVTIGGFAILLDGRAVKTPGKSELILPTEGLANAVAEEWAVQGAHIDPSSMPLTKLANTAIDRVRGREGEIADKIARYAGSDLICYRAEQPPKLVAAQEAAWGPVLTWAKQRHGITVATTSGLMHIAQPAGALAGVRALLDQYDGFALCALHNMTTLTGSALMALAHAEGLRDAEATWAAAHVDEDFQIEQWGADTEAADRRAYRWREMKAAATLLALARRG